MNPTDIVQVENLRKRYGSLTAVDGVSFVVRQGETFGILGPNGAGKTTIVEILEGMRSLDGGLALVNGVDVDRNPRGVKSIIGVQLQTSSFFDHLKLTELLTLFGSFYHRSVDSMAILKEVEMDDKAGSTFDKLSGGQKQRFSIACALVNEPLVMFLDEPTTALDPQARRHMWNLIKRFKSAGRTIVLTTHYMEEAEILCDRVAIMDRGRIIAMKPPEELIDDLLAEGFRKDQPERQANLEDVFLALTGHALRDE